MLLNERRVLWGLEVGDGSEVFAHMLFEKTNIPHLGFGSSPVAVDRAARRTGRAALVRVSDAQVADTYAEPVDTGGICTETVEHVPGDFALVNRWPPSAAVRGR